MEEIFLRVSYENSVLVFIEVRGPPPRPLGTTERDGFFRKILPPPILDGDEESPRLLFLSSSRGDTTSGAPARRRSVARHARESVEEGVWRDRRSGRSEGIHHCGGCQHNSIVIKAGKRGGTGKQTADSFLQALVAMHTRRVLIACTFHAVGY